MIERSTRHRLRASKPVRVDLDWTLTVTPPEEAAGPESLPADARWTEAVVPGTALLSLRRAGVVPPDAVPDLHASDVWYRASVSASAGSSLRFLGLAGLAEIWIDGVLNCRSDNMFVSRTVLLERDGTVDVALCFRSLSRALGQSGGRARWRTRLVTSNALRLHRQTLLGHMPGWCSELPAIGPFRPVELIGGGGCVESCLMSARVEGGDGVLSVRVTFSDGTPAGGGLFVRVGEERAALREVAPCVGLAELRVPDVSLWWPHTHGEPVLYDVVLVDRDRDVALGRTGFRSIEIDRGADGRGFSISVNGVAVFCRGACWTNAEPVGLGGEREDYLPWLRLVREAGMNMVRVGGTMTYESAAFHALCDEMGILVWQDLMFANMDYPLEREALRDSALREVVELVERVSGSPSLAVLCGGSEIAQQAAMLGLEAERRAMPFFETIVPDLVRALAPGLHYVPHSPWGGELPFTVGAGVSHYYGVGAYRRPLEDARRARVRFATECLAFANPPSATSPAARHVRVAPRDLGVSWDFADVRDFYLRDLYGRDPAQLRSDDPARYFALSRAVTADLMEAVFSEWRRPGSSCAGGLVWQLGDLAPGSLWGVVDSARQPKAAWHGLRRVLAPVQVLVSDEGLDGLEFHVINETAEPVQAVLRLACLRRGVTRMVEGECGVELAPRAGVSLSSRGMLDRFFDINGAYRFGPIEHEVTVVTLHSARSGEVLSDAFHFPHGRALVPDDLGLTARLDRDGTGWMLEISTERFAQAVHVEIEEYWAAEEWFHLPPGRTRRVALVGGVERDAGPPDGFVHALNSRHPVLVRSAA